jgi:hypothetical protein
VPDQIQMTNYWKSVVLADLWPASLSLKRALVRHQNSGCHFGISRIGSLNIPEMRTGVALLELDP